MQQNVFHSLALLESTFLSDMGCILLHQEAVNIFRNHEGRLERLVSKRGFHKQLVFLVDFIDMVLFFKSYFPPGIHKHTNNYAINARIDDSHNHHLPRVLAPDYDAMGTNPACEMKVARTVSTNLRELLFPVFPTLNIIISCKNAIFFENYTIGTINNKKIRNLVLLQLVRGGIAEKKIKILLKKSVRWWLENQRSLTTIANQNMRNLDHDVCD